jgi:steroid delta-isomerase
MAASGVFAAAGGRPHALSDRQQMTREQMERHAARWIAAWNRRDVDAVLGDYVDDARFVSPKALAFVGSARIDGKARLGAYWREALRRIPTLAFRLDRVLCDVERREMVVLYEADLGGTKSRACEFMRFDETGRQIEGEALYGAPL